MKTRFRFEKPEVWQEARKINQIILRLTRRFPRQGMFTMTSEIRRAAILDPLFDEMERLAKRIASLNRSLEAETSKTPFTRRARSQALDPRR